MYFYKKINVFTPLYEKEKNMRERPIIGITQSREERGKLLVVEDYINAIRSAGGVGVILPNDTDQAVEFAEEFDGFVFGGGGDISPLYYKENNFPTELLDIDPERDTFEEKLFSSVFSMGKPILGICRGAQIMNVFLGGTLYPYIEGHISKIKNAEIWHNLTVLEGNLLHKCVKNSTILVNSRHKQIIKARGNNVVTCAVSDDGFVEAIEVKNYPTFCLGVQFHPENFYKHDAAARRIFEAFVNATKQMEN